MEETPAQWIADQLTWWEHGVIRVSALLPGGYPAYARLLHPAGVRTDIRWSSLAGHPGRTVHPEVQWDSLVADLPWHDERPLDGVLPAVELEALVEVLRRHTTTPDRCRLCLWDGFGGVEYPPHAPTVRTPGRRYVLSAGPIDEALDFTPGLFRQPPNLWWPDDRARVVASEIDLPSTYVAGTEALVAEVLAHPAFEAVPSALPLSSSFWCVNSGPGPGIHTPEREGGARGS